MKRVSSLVGLCGILLACQPAAEKEISLATPIRHDDFLYVVRQVDKADAIGTLKPNGQFWIVQFEVINQAKRVKHVWNNAIAYLTDAAGHRYENGMAAQAALQRQQSFGWQPKQYVTPAGQTTRTRLIFDLPKTVENPFLQVRGETLMGDVFDGHQFEHTKVRLVR